MDFPRKCVYSLGLIPTNIEALATILFLHSLLPGQGSCLFMEEVNVIEHHVSLSDLLQVEQATHTNPCHEAVFTMELRDELQDQRGRGEMRIRFCRNATATPM